MSLQKLSETNAYHNAAQKARPQSHSRRAFVDLEGWLLPSGLGAGSAKVGTTLAVRSCDIRKLERDRDSTKS